MATARRTRSTTPPLTLGFTGTGELAQEATWALLDDLVDGQKVEMVYLPVTDADTTDEIVHAHRWCVDRGHPYSTVSDADAAKIKALKKIIDGGEDDYEVSDAGAGRDIIDLLAGDESDPVADGRLLMFFNGEVENDIDLFEYAGEQDVAAFDLLDELSPLKYEDEGDGTAPEPEPAKDEVSERRSRRQSKAADPEPEPTDSGYSPEEQKEYDTISKLTLVELKKMAKSLGDPDITTESLRGTDKEYVADLIIVTKRNQGAASDPEPADEAQATARPTRGRRKATESAEQPQEPAEGDDGAEDPKDVVFARLRASRERAELITKNLVAALGAIAEEGEPEEVLERAAAAVAASLMLFAEYVIVEVRKPKSAGRPRADGTEAQPKPAVDPTAPRRGRGRPRKSADE